MLKNCMNKLQHVHDSVTKIVVEKYSSSDVSIM